MHVMPPPVGTAGKFNVKNPYVVGIDTSYKVVSVSRIETLESNGVNVLNDYYITVGLDVTHYDADIQDEISIVTLKEVTGEVTNVPASYILNYPASKEVDYSRLAIVIEVGLLPDKITVEALLDTVTQQATSYLGIQAITSLVRLPHEGFIDEEAHTKLEQARATNKKYDKTPTTALLEAESTIEELKQRISVLEGVVVRLDEASL